MDWAVFFKEYPAVVTAVVGLLGIVIGVVLTKWNDRRKKSAFEKGELDTRAAVHDSKIKEARDLVDVFDSIICGLVSHVEQLVTVIKESDADQIMSEFRKMNELRLMLKSLLAESKSRFADIALLNDRRLLEMFLNLADSARTVSEEAQAIPGEYAYGDSAFAHTRLKKLQDILAESLLGVKSIKREIEELAAQIE
jgi:hypothetical protein